MFYAWLVSGESFSVATCTVWWWLYVVVILCSVLRGLCVCVCVCVCVHVWGKGITKDNGEIKKEIEQEKGGNVPTKGFDHVEFAIVFARRYIAYVCISLDVDRKLHVVFVRLKEGMSSAQCSMRLIKVAEGLAL